MRRKAVPVKLVSLLEGRNGENVINVHYWLLTKKECIFAR